MSDTTPEPSESSQTTRSSGTTTTSETTEKPKGRGGVRGIGIILIIAGVVFAVAGVVAYIAVQQTLSDQKIVVSDDADMFAGKDVKGPFTAYAQAMVIGKHAKEIAGGKTYAELPQNDPNRDTVMTASFLQASLFTSVVAFGVAAMATVMGIILILLGWAIRRLAPPVA
jgi:hypothetical protein